jgi:hypothetical protein
VGLKDFQAEALSKRLVQMNSAYVDVALLAAKFDRLKRCIPGAPSHFSLPLSPSLGSLG